MKLGRSIPLKMLADSVGVRFRGDPDCLIDGLATLERAEDGDLSFLSNRSYKKYLNTTRASAVIMSAEDEKDCSINALISTNPRLSLAKVTALFDKKSSHPTGIHPTVVIGEGCNIPSSVSIGAYTVLGNDVVLGDGVVIQSGCAIGDACQIGADSVLKDRVVLYQNVKIGQKCCIHSGSVIGSDGFGFANDAGTWVKVPHIGSVVIGNQVDIGANTTIDRGFLEDTTIGDGVIIDNLVQIGHNVSIGDHTAIAGCVGIAGSTVVGKYCLIGGGASIAGHIQIADQVHITAISGVNHSLTTKGVYSSGFPAKPATTWRKNVARFQYLDKMAKRLKMLENKLQVTTHLTEDE
jgi:UDP-3-O-[3-hydroxymyristoyl] glucosamine N-acyltransferase